LPVEAMELQIGRLETVRNNARFELEFI